MVAIASRVLMLSLGCAAAAGCANSFTGPTSTFLTSTAFTGPFNDVAGGGEGVLTLSFRPLTAQGEASGSWLATFRDASRNLGGSLLFNSQGLSGPEVGFTMTIAGSPAGCVLAFEGRRVHRQLTGTIHAGRTFDGGPCPQEPARHFAVVLNQR